MLSNVNLLNDIGKHIVIYPLKNSKNENAFDLDTGIEGASFDFTASRYAWSISKKESVVSNGSIYIEPHDTVIIFTNESISLDEYYAGACYSKLTFSVQGINHSSSPLKPGYTGRLSVSLHNDTDKSFKINVGDSIVVIMLHKLDKPSNITYGNGKGSRFDILSALEINITRKEREEIAKYDDRNKILDWMKEEENYKKFKKQRFKKFHILKKMIFLFILIIFLIVVGQLIGLVELIKVSIGGLIVFILDRIINHDT